ncbi:hypothetical protein ACI65C_011426 [Semiaphis heraclei]
MTKPNRHRLCSSSRQRPSKQPPEYADGQTECDGCSKRATDRPVERLPRDSAERPGACVVGRRDVSNSYACQSSLLLVGHGKQTTVEKLAFPKTLDRSVTSEN